MKRYLALFFIILTNAILFVHAIVPHHHHGMIIVWNIHHPESHIHTSHEQEDTCPCHQHTDEQSDDMKCQLNHPIIIPSYANLDSSTPSFDIAPLFDIQRNRIEDIDSSLKIDYFSPLKIPDKIKIPLVKGWSSLAPPMC